MAKVADSRDDLLRPSLSIDAPPVAVPYTVQATVLTGFLGGPFAAFGIVGLNSVRLRRFLRDVPVLIPALGVSLAAIWFLIQDPATNSRVLVRLYSRLAGVFIVGAGYLLHRREQRNTDLANLDRPNGWTPGAVCVIVGGILYALFVYVLL